MLKWIRGDKKWWSPIAQGWGLVIFFIGLVSIVINNSTTWLGWFNIGAGIVFYLLGIFLSISKDKIFWSSAILRTAIPVFFFGVVFVTISPWGGGLIIIAGLALLFSGIAWAPK